jgi:hypothetical protein
VRWRARGREHGHAAAGLRRGGAWSGSDRETAAAAREQQARARGGGAGSEQERAAAMRAASKSARGGVGSEQGAHGCGGTVARRGGGARDLSEFS